jgi:hypothetical protein
MMVPVWTGHRWHDLILQSIHPNMLAYFEIRICRQATADAAQPNREAVGVGWIGVIGNLITWLPQVSRSPNLPTMAGISCSESSIAVRRTIDSSCIQMSCNCCDLRRMCRGMIDVLINQSMNVLTQQKSGPPFRPAAVQCVCSWSIKNCIIYVRSRCHL